MEPNLQPDTGPTIPGALRAYLDVSALAPPATPEMSAIAALHALGLGPGSRIAFPVWGATAMADALALCDYEILPLDVDPDTGRLDVSSVARERDAFEALWMTDVNGLPPEAAQLAALARARDAMVLEEVRESLGAVCQGQCPGSRADAVLLRMPGRVVRVGSASAALVEECALNLPAPDIGDAADAGNDSDLEAWLESLPARLAGQRRIAALLESAWGPLDALRLPDYSPGTRGTWPRFTVRVLSGDMDYPNAAWVRWLKPRGIRVGTPVRKLLHGLDADDPAVMRRFPGAVEYLRRTLCFGCGPDVTLELAEKTVYAVDELSRRESGSRS